ncbi:pogo transposable element with ZNF domain [Sander vitreus]
MATGPSAPASSPPKVVMSVEEFYYGTFEGDLSLRKPLPLGIKPSAFICQICSHMADTNLRFMHHMLQHSELIGAGSDDRKCCRFCYRQFSSPAQLQSHQDQVHGSAQSSSMCRICEWAFENEPAFLNHMKSNHKPGEMPYVCQVCSYRSSFYSDVLSHFASFHRESRFLLCLFCLKVNRNPVSYQQHLLRHQMNQAFHCNRCRLQFVFLKDKMQHKLENHRSFRRPAQLEGLPPGSKVTIRTYGKVRTLPSASPGVRLQSPSSLIQPINIKTEKPATQRSPPLFKPPRSPTKKTVSRRVSVDRTSCPASERLLCLECGTDISDFSAHYPTHVSCLLCPYASCCSRAYATHMIHHHVPRPKDKVVPLHRLPPPCVFELQCSDCDFQPQNADEMAEHLLKNPDHYSATCRPRTYVEQDIQFFPGEEREPVQNQDQDQEQDQDFLSDAPWRSADRWKRPSESDDIPPAIVPFSLTSGPRHLLSKNTDAIDFFNLLFPAALVQLIATETNAHVKTIQFQGASGAVADWRPVSVQEIRGFLGLVILMGVQNLSDPAHYWSWSHYDNSYTFCRAMSLQRFRQIAANIRMGSFVTEALRGSHDGVCDGDPLSIFRPMLAILGDAVWDAYRPNCCLSIDRALLPRMEEDSGHATEDARTPPQVWLLCDSKSGYCHRFFIQAGEKESGAGLGASGAVRGASGAVRGASGAGPGFSVVPALVEKLQNKHHQLFLSSSLASAPLLQKLLEQKIYACSSFPPPSAILPRALWDDGSLHRPGDFLQRRCGPLLATRWRDAKEMGCLSTNAPPGEADTVWRRSQTKVGGLDPIDRPMAFRLLQENMRGVDICKQLLACNPLGGVPLDRHWRRLFWFLVNLSIVNAFIVLRESRKENPPPWVTDGLFTQVNFRKRLGNQLAKCAQKSFEALEMASVRVARAVARPVDAPLKQRHHMVKISNISKRCRNCNRKNVRHESVYGCGVCNANLCKQSSCFWEFHNLSPLRKGSTKVGFLKDRISGAVEVEEFEGDVDGAMAPVEEFSDDERLDDLNDIDEEADDGKEDFIRDVKRPTPGAVATTVSGSPTAAVSGVTAAAAMACREREDSLSARQLRVALIALCDGLQHASRLFSTDTHTIRRWLQDARKRLKRSDLEKTAEGGEGNGSDRMLAWVLSMREQQLPITESNLFHKASALKKKGAFGDAFRISYDWAVGFLLRQRLGVRSVGRAPTLARTLPLSLHAKIQSFREFTQKIARTHELPESAVAAVDELCVFVDLRLVQDKSRRRDALELTGSVPLVTVYLAALADGSMLPALVLASRQLAKRAPLPEFIVLEGGAESLLAEEALDLWTNRVWLRHVNAASQHQKSLLVLDRHREHMGDPFLTAVSAASTLPAVIPAGCAFRLQPIEICVKPVLQRFLLARWAAFSAGSPAELEETSPPQLQANVAQLLVDWTVEALTQLEKLPQVWKTSFRLTGVLSRRDGEEEETSQQAEEIQSALIKTLTETLLGADASNAESPELLELEDEEETEEEGGGGGEEEEEEGKGTTEVARSDTMKDGEETEEETTTTGEGKDTIQSVEDIKETEEDRTEDRKETEEDRTEDSKEKEEDRKEDSKETEEDRKEDSKETEEDRKEDSKETEEDRKETEEDRKETEEDRKERSKETEEDRNDRSKETEDRKERSKETEEDRKERSKETEEDRKETKEETQPEKEDSNEVLEDEKETKEDIKTLEEDSEEEGKETEEDRKEGSKERRETRIVIGEEVGDEWKITVKSRSDGAEGDGEEEEL